ncbi:PilZ domain-containing protein [Enterovirga sp.]|jgi:c-di-GMP-binding flagellar brake protein YcgR|uniref:PilZ domain-containing protein n=1 Tax=Enterovirga sp. TaxID=2026350 RepID=UPI0026168BA2|nr:PilZ domain-containing protein [Enterovirga sp.]MDB5592777.1 type pilus assembly PilZ [Enterovirga sp.]
MSAILARAPRLAARPVERRRHQRVTVALLGRYMLSDRQEYPCQTVDISPGGALVVAPVRGQIGERVIAYLEHIGRVEGEITRHVPHGFAFSFAAAPRKRDKLASQLTWLANRQTLGLPEDRRHERIVPRAPAVVLRLESGREFEGRLIDVSLSGAGITLDGSKPAIGTSLSVGSTYSKVVRHFQGGIAVEFKLALSPDRLDENIIL